MCKLFNKLAFLFSLIIFSSSLHAQDPNVKLETTALISKLNVLTSDNVSLKYDRNSDHISFITLKNSVTITQPFNGVSSSDPVETAKNFLTEYKSLFGDEYKSEYSLIRDNQSDNRHSVKLRQMFNGIPVFAGEMVVRMNQSLEITGVNGKVASNLSIPIKPVVNKDEAAQIATTLVEKLVAP